MQAVSAKKGGFRTMPFIIANEVFEMVASDGLQPYILLYLINGYHMDTATGSNILSLWGASSAFLAMLGAFISDSYFGRFRVIALGSTFSFLGITLLWLTAMIPQAKPSPCNSFHTECKNATFGQLALLFSSLGCMAMGTAFIRPCSMAFGADQLVKQDNLEKNESVLDSYFNWYYASMGISDAIAFTVIVYIQDQFGMKVGFGVPVILMLFSSSFFMAGSSMYVKVKSHKSLFTGLAQVVVAAFKNRHLPSPTDNLDGLYYHSEDSNFATPSEKLRFLNKACIIKNPEEDFNYDGSAVKPWELCTLDQVEELKALISVLPIWSSGFMIYVTLGQLSIGILQANIMDRHITTNFQFPAGSFILFTSLSFTIWTAFYNKVAMPLITKYTGRSHGISPTQRMAIGLIISCLAMTYGAILENIRRKTAIQDGLSDYPKTVVNMSAMWLIPLFMLTGLAEGFNAVGQIEYYFSQLPKSMSSIAAALFTFGNAFSGFLGSLIITIVNNVTKRGGNISWLSTDLNKGHYDYFYGLLTLLSVLNFVYFCVVCREYGPQEHVRAMISNDKDAMKESLLSKSREPNTFSA